VGEAFEFGSEMDVGCHDRHLCQGPFLLATCGRVRHAEWIDGGGLLRHISTERFDLVAATGPEGAA
jgi:hypothetical protein